MKVIKLARYIFSIIYCNHKDSIVISIEHHSKKTNYFFLRLFVIADAYKHSYKLLAKKYSFSTFTEATTAEKESVSTRRKL